MLSSDFFFFLKSKSILRPNEEKVNLSSTQGWENDGHLITFCPILSSMTSLLLPKCEK